MPVAVHWTSSHLVGRTVLIKRTLFNHTEYVWVRSFFKSVKAGFLPSYSTMTRSMKVSGFLVASVPFTLTEYFTSPITSLHPLVFPDEYRDLRGELDVFSRIASGFRSLADSFQLGLAASSADVTRRLANTPSDVGPSFSSSRRWSGRRCRPWRSGWWRRLRYYSGSLNRCSDDCRKILERFLRSSDMFLRTSWNTLINLRVKFWQTWYGNLLKDGFQTLIKFFKLLLRMLIILDWPSPRGPNLHWRPWRLFSLSFTNTENW